MAARPSVLAALGAIAAFALAAAALATGSLAAGHARTNGGGAAIPAPPASGEDRGRAAVSMGHVVDATAGGTREERAPEHDGTAAATGTLLLPDGTTVPALNGAIAPPPLQRALGNRPFAPIVGIERSPLGVDWYVHADGVRSTTEMRWRDDLGRYDALTRVAAPTDAVTPAAAAPPPLATGTGAGAGATAK